jgi:hypothetical protein
MNQPNRALSFRLNTQSESDQDEPRPCLAFCSGTAKHRRFPFISQMRLKISAPPRAPFAGPAARN